jgi:hypothetical protein
MEDFVHVRPVYVKEKILKKGEVAKDIARMGKNKIACPSIVIRKKIFDEKSCHFGQMSARGADVYFTLESNIAGVEFYFVHNYLM